MKRFVLIIATTALLSVCTFHAAQADTAMKMQQKRYGAIAREKQNSAATTENNTDVEADHLNTIAPAAGDTVEGGNTSGTNILKRSRKNFGNLAKEKQNTTQ